MTQRFSLYCWLSFAALELPNPRSAQFASCPIPDRDPVSAGRYPPPPPTQAARQPHAAALPAVTRRLVAIRQVLAAIVTIPVPQPQAAGRPHDRHRLSA